MTFEEMDELQKAIYGDKPMTTSNSRGPIDSLPVVLGKMDPSLLDNMNRDPHRNCYHDWGNVYDDYNGVYKCKKCGKYSA